MAAHIRTEDDRPRHYVRTECPTTGREVVADAMTTEEFDALAPDEGGIVGCPACGEKHAWTKAEARIPNGR